MPELTPLNHTGSVRLETERLVLRPTAITDAEQMFNNWASDPEVTRYMHWLSHADIEVTKGVLAKWDSENEMLDNYHWGIELKETRQIIGTCRTIDINEKTQSTERSII